ncbi:Neutral/alkaline non-lysosomal ceramidase-domain-containing protein [Apiosordaria backusii]|uniref:ceramidase n=1 Tax=Apiosordaria backusii TaxID=314023 RepID=A0AA40BK52_9PEZI|nr:Neutral/alkaline non-lysosomal ceramidase-domain-containing protein [Apiosordaria backusii]
METHDKLLGEEQDHAIWDSEKGGGYLQQPLLSQQQQQAQDGVPNGKRSTSRRIYYRSIIAYLTSILGAIILGAALLRLLAAENTRKWTSWTTSTSHTSLTGDQYLLGVGKSDITGPVVEINLMGYADPKQVGSGLRQRLYSRAFIVGNIDNPSDRFVYLVLDTQSGDTAIRYGILNTLSTLGPEYKVYGHHNVAVTGTHSHAGPAGWLNYLLPQITSKGFDHQGYQAIVDGAVESIRKAHESLAPGYLSVGTTKVFGANINRSLFAYLANPEAERARYNTSLEDDGSVEKDLTLLKFQRASDGKDIGVLTWFPVHGTSLLGNNTLVAGDNKGVAAYLFEKSLREENPDFVAGFSQASVGDTSPNVLGAWCEDGSGEMCSFENSTCPVDGKSQACHGRGPGFGVPDNGASSCYEIGRRQFEPAKRLFDAAGDLKPVRGGWVKSFHKFHHMSGYEFALPDGRKARTCPAALGYSFAAGTSDGPGAFDFKQHDGNENTTSPVWKVVSRFLKDASEEQRRCHWPKPILLDVGEMERPYLWTPNIVDVQVFRVGQFFIVVSPGEATTMAGRRWKEAVAGHADAGEDDPMVVLGGPANSYTHYITTEEEYGIQRYEGASTLYGPHTLAAYINVTLSLLSYLSPDSPAPPPHDQKSMAFPPDNTNRSLSFIPSVVMDNAPLFKSFGDVLADVEEDTPYIIGDVVKVRFVGANPRNNLRLGQTYAAVEKLGKDGEWERFRDDGDWGLVFEWKRTSELMGWSEVQVGWDTAVEGEGEIEKGSAYRIRYYGDKKGLLDGVEAFEGLLGQSRACSSSLFSPTQRPLYLHILRFNALYKEKRADVPPSHCHELRESQQSELNSMNVVAYLTSTAQNRQTSLCHHPESDPYTASLVWCGLVLPACLCFFFSAVVRRDGDPWFLKIGMVRERGKPKNPIITVDRLESFVYRARIGGRSEPCCCKMMVVSVPTWDTRGEKATRSLCLWFWARSSGCEVGDEGVREGVILVVSSKTGGPFLHSIAGLRTEIQGPRDWEHLSPTHPRINDSSSKDPF